MITKPDIAYKIGLSDSLGEEVYSGFREILKWSFEPGRRQRRLHAAYYAGFLEGTKLKMEVRRENKEKGLVAGKEDSDGASVATLRSSEFNN